MGNCQNFPNGAGSNGSAGGHAVRIDGDVNLTIENVSGKIWGGGGGGGGGSNCYRINSPCEPGAGGGGGGGAGRSVTGGDGGDGGEAKFFGSPECNGTGGNPGTGGPSGAPGTGGPGCGSNCTGGQGGAGGAFGAGGSAGSNGSNGDGGRIGGSGGYSVRHEGTGTVTYDSGGVQGVDIKGTTD